MHRNTGGDPRPGSGGASRLSRHLSGDMTMKTNGRSMMLAGVVAVGLLTFGAAPARAQAVGFGYAGPGMSFGFSAGNYGYGGYGYPAPVVGGYAGVVGAPVVVGAP